MALRKVPDNFGGLSGDGEVAPADVIDETAEGDALVEPDADGYVRPERIAPAGLPVQVVGQSVERGRSVPAPRPLRDFTPEQLDTQIVAPPGYAPLDRTLRCPSCGSTVGVFYRDAFTGAVRHQGCSPNMRTQGVQAAPREEPYIPEHDANPREFTVQDATAGMKPPEDIG